MFIKIKEFIECLFGLILLFAIIIAAIAFNGCVADEAYSKEPSESKYSNWFYEDNTNHVRLMNYYNVNSQLQFKILDSVYIAAEEYGISPDLFLAIIAVESSFNPNSISDKGAVGLMQVMPSVWETTLKEVRIIEETEDLKEVGNNIMAGGYILCTYLKQGAKLYKMEYDIVKYAIFRYLGISKNEKHNMDYYNKVLSILGRYHLYGGVVDTSFYINKEG